MYTLLNAAPDTGNQGVSALSFSATSELAKRGVGPFAIADHGAGVRSTSWDFDAGRQNITLFGLTNTRRFWRGDCLHTVCAMARMGGWVSQSARVTCATAAFLDASGGDSFTDLYGKKRFQTMVKTKQLALDLGRPLVLLPQTLGPFRCRENMHIAFDILRRATAVFVRDASSFEILKQAVGKDFDPLRHHKSPDMALLLPKREPSHLPKPISTWLQEAKQTPIVGLNVSGLLYIDDKGSREAFGLKDSHRAQIFAAATALLDSQPKTRLLLVPHVDRPEGHLESDLKAAKMLAAELNKNCNDRVAVLPNGYDAQELKWIISQLSWFSGARMHATIAAFSSGVPTLGLGYSDKAEGVFREVGLIEEVADLRVLNASQLAEVIRRSLHSASATRSKLEKLLPVARTRAIKAMDQIADLLMDHPA